MLIQASSIPLCFHCNSKLILVSEITEKLENSLFPQTTSTYRCSNKTCQEKIDEETNGRLKAQKQRKELLEQKLSKKK